MKPKQISSKCLLVDTTHVIGHYLNSAHSRKYIYIEILADGHMLLESLFSGLCLTFWYSSYLNFNNTWAQFHNQRFTLIVNLIIADQLLNDSLCCSNKYN